MMMRLGHMVLLSALAGLAACGPKAEPEKTNAPATAAPLAAADMPRLKAGLWTIAVEGAPAGAGGSLCMDETIQEQMSLLAGPPTPGCEAGTFTPIAGGGFTTRAVCERDGGGTTISEGRITGDFETAYRTEVRITTTGAPSEQMNGTMTMGSTFTYAGDCPAGMKPGDMDLGGGMRMNLADMAAQAQAPAP